MYWNLFYAPRPSPKRPAKLCMFGIPTHCGHRRYVLYTFLNSSENLKFFRNNPRPPSWTLSHVFVGPNYKIKVILCELIRLQASLLKSGKLPVNEVNLKWLVEGDVDRCTLPQSFRDFCGSLPMYKASLITGDSTEQGESSISLGK